MVIAYDVNTVQEYVAQSRADGGRRVPVLIDQFSGRGDGSGCGRACPDGTDVVIGGIMEHIEEGRRTLGATLRACCHRSGLSPKILDTIRDYTKRLALALKVVGLMNVQYAIQRDNRPTSYEVNPARLAPPFRSSARATGVPLAKIGARLMVGRRLADMNLPLGAFERGGGNCRSRFSTR